MPYAGKKRPRTRYSTRKSRASRPAPRPRKFRSVARRGRAYGRRILRRAPITRNLGNIIPDRVMCKFRCADTWTPSAGATGGAVQFYANNVYDPRVGISTTKCSGVTQLMSIYNYGVVYACRVTIKMMPQTVNSIGFLRWTDSVLGSPSSLPSSNLLLEAPQNTRWKHKAVYAYNETPLYLADFKKMKYLEKKTELEPNDYKFTSTAGPAKPTFIQIGYIPADSTNTTSYNWNMFIRLTYYCRLFERKTTNIAE